MASRCNSRSRWVLACLAGSLGVGVPTGIATAQSGEPIETVREGDAPAWVRQNDTPAYRAYLAQQKKRVAMEKELRRLRAKHFGGIGRVETRQAGILRLREYTDPAIFPSLVQIFQGEKEDVRRALVDHFIDHASEEGDAALAWMAIFGVDEALRRMASDALRGRLDASDDPPNRVRLLVYEGLTRGDDKTITAAAQVASQINLFEAIPWLVATQVAGQVAGVNQGGSANGALAWIMVGEQTAFVSDLQPVVGPNAVAFDPELSVINTGVILRVIDAVVITYRIDVHNALVDLSTRLGGRPTGGMGWDLPRWRQWLQTDYAEAMKAHRLAQAARREAARKAAASAPARASGNPSASPSAGP